jgi:alkylation response protein AidB-like acyl-CoA dehydrogenase
MPTYKAPLRDMRYVMYELLDAPAVLRSIPAHANVDAETIDAVLEEAAKFAEQVVQPLNVVGDREGCTYHGDGVVTAPPGFKAAYQRFADDGWPALSCDTRWGGQGLPVLLNNRLYEMMNSASQAWLMYSGLSHSAYECLVAIGTPEQQATYLPKLISGEWSGTMCLTEPHSGTDLGMLKTRAEPNGDGSYALTGTKIFISSGEHDCTSNILHLVLARLPDAPAGTRGISLFLVPKFLPDADGNPGERNSIKAGSIEHKMGIHGNATCVMNLDGARGFLIGEAHKGMPAMFIMMNSARLGVGMQSLGLAEVAHQNAAAYARDRRQGRSLRGPQEPAAPADTLLVHPDVRRMLLTSKAYTEGGRALTCWVALLTDLERGHPDAAVREDADELIALLTPVVKAFITDNAFTTTNLCLEVLGGHGYITEWGMDQFVRDARINTIYEGTNGVQAMDLLGRKVLHDHGARLGRFAARVQAFLDDSRSDAARAEFTGPLAALLMEVSALTADIAARAATDPDEVGAAATPYLRVLGHLAYAWLWARMGSLALAHLDDAFHRAKLATARYYFARLLPETAMLFAQARSRASDMMAIDGNAI